MSLRISVVIPVYQVKAYLDDCLASIVHQTVPFDEIILVDDGSRDGSGELCDAWKEKDARIHVIHQENGGLSVARNTGMDAARGEYLLFVDSDDTIDLDTVERFEKAMGDRRPDLMVANLRIVTDEKIRHRPHTLSDSQKTLTGAEYLKREYAARTMHMASVQCLYKRRFLIERHLRFTPDLLHEDELFTPVVFSKAQSVIPTGIEFYNHMMREGSITTSKNKTRNAESIVKICYLLEEWAKELEDQALAKQILDHCVDIFFKVFTDANLAEHKEISLSKRYLIAHSSAPKNRLRTFMYLLSPKLLYHAEKRRRAL